MEKLVGKNLVLRKARESDLENIYRRVWSDREVLRLMFIRPSTDPDEAKERMRRTIAYQQEKPVYFAALKETDEVIGLGGMMEEAPGVYSEAGLAIGRDMQGRGYGKEMLGLLLDAAFSEYGASVFAYYCMRENERSRRLALHFGFRYDSEKEETRSYDGRVFIIERYILNRAEYLLQKKENNDEKSTYHRDEDGPV